MTSCHIQVYPTHLLSPPVQVRQSYLSQIPPLPEFLVQAWESGVPTVVPALSHHRGKDSYYSSHWPPSVLDKVNVAEVPLTGAHWYMSL